MSSLFHWNPKSTVGGSGRKRKGATKTTCRKKLASCTQENVPDSEERASLQIAGLGEKRITLYLSSEAHDIYQELIYQFPKLDIG